MRKRNWREYNRQLVQRGSITFLVDPKFLKGFRSKEKRKGRGRPLEFSNPVIIMLMMMKIHYRLSYRVLEGFSKSIQILMRHISSLPTYTLICKRAAFLKDKLPKLSNQRPEVVILDASGVKIYG